MLSLCADILKILLDHIQGVQALSTGHGNLVFVGSASGVTAMDASKDGSEPQLVSLGDDGRGNCVDLAVGYASREDLDTHIIAATLENGRHIFSSISHDLLIVTLRGQRCAFTHQGQGSQ